MQIDCLCGISVAKQLKSSHEWEQFAVMHIRMSDAG